MQGLYFFILQVNVEECVFYQARYAFTKQELEGKSGLEKEFGARIVYIKELKCESDPLEKIKIVEEILSDAKVTGKLDLQGLERKLLIAEKSRLFI